MKVIDIEAMLEDLKTIQELKDTLCVIKYGGSIMNDHESVEGFLEDVSRLCFLGIKVVIVHGGGPFISEYAKCINVEPNFIEGLRVTDEHMIKTVEMVLTGSVNPSIVGGLSSKGVQAIGISGRDSHLLKAHKKYIIKDNEKVDIGYVGEVESVKISVIKDLLDRGYIPVISPIGEDKDGNVYNINADYVASAISAGLKSKKLILLTDVKGLYKDIKDPSTFIDTIHIKTIKKYIEKGIIKGGMIPKMQCCIEAIEKGVENVHLIDGKIQHGLLLEMFTNQPMGTVIKGGDCYV